MIMEANEGQADPRVSFIARGDGATILLTQAGIEVVVPAADKDIANRIVEIGFENQNPQASFSSQEPGQQRIGYASKSAREKGNRSAQKSPESCDR